MDNIDIFVDMLIIGIGSLSPQESPDFSKMLSCAVLLWKDRGHLFNTMHNCCMISSTDKLSDFVCCESELLSENVHKHMAGFDNVLFPAFSNQMCSRYVKM